MQQHQPFVDEARRQNKLRRDHFLTVQEARNCEHKLSSAVWKYHEDEATSVRMFQQRHSDHVFMYQEQQPEQPATDTQPKQPAQPFTIAIVTDDMRANAKQYGHDGVACIDSTFSTNQQKFPLYTALVVDEHGNGRPIFEVVCESASEEAVTAWMTAYQQHIRQFQSDWRPSCFMADDAQADINPIR